MLYHIVQQITRTVRFIGIQLIHKEQSLQIEEHPLSPVTLMYTSQSIVFSSAGNLIAAVSGTKLSLSVC